MLDACETCRVIQQQFGMKEYVTFFRGWGSEHTLIPPAYFHGGRDTQPPRTYTPVVVMDAVCVWTVVYGATAVSSRGAVNCHVRRARIRLIARLDIKFTAADARPSHLAGSAQWRSQNTGSARIRCPQSIISAAYHRCKNVF